MRNLYGERELWQGSEEGANQSRAKENPLRRYTFPLWKEPASSSQVEQNNSHHARELMQSRVQHEEDIDLAKRVAVRENLRDEWGQLTDKAETVLIVNTLMLGVSWTVGVPP